MLAVQNLSCYLGKNAARSLLPVQTSSCYLVENADHTSSRLLPWKNADRTCSQSFYQECWLYRILVVTLYLGKKVWFKKYAEKKFKKYKKFSQFLRQKLKFCLNFLPYEKLITSCFLFLPSIKGEKKIFKNLLIFLFFFYLKLLPKIVFHSDCSLQSKN